MFGVYASDVIYSALSPITRNYSVTPTRDEFPAMGSFCFPSFPPQMDEVFIFFPEPFLFFSAVC